MSDIDDDKLENINSPDFDKDLENNSGSNINQDMNILEKGRLTQNSNNNDMLFSNRFTVVENIFVEGQNEKKDESLNSSKNNNNNSNVEEVKKKKHNKEEEKKEEYKTNIEDIKIITVGDVSVGKTSIITRYVDNSFKSDYICTIQAEQRTKIIKEDEKTSIRLNIWDTVGQEKFRSITRQYYRDCEGALIVFDLTRRKTFDNISSWINEIKNYGNRDTTIVILGNKSDITEEREIPENDIKESILNEYIYYEVSAKNGNNISLAFDKLKKSIMTNKNLKREKEKEVKKETQKDGKKKNKEEKKTQSLEKFNKDYKETNKKCC